jgi:hypothetical protein
MLERVLNTTHKNAWVFQCVYLPSNFERVICCFEAEKEAEENRLKRVEEKKLTTSSLRSKTSKALSLALKFEIDRGDDVKRQLLGVESQENFPCDQVITDSMESSNKNVLNEPEPMAGRKNNKHKPRTNQQRHKLDNTLVVEPNASKQLFSNKKEKILSDKNDEIGFENLEVSPEFEISKNDDDILNKLDEVLINEPHTSQKVSNSPGRNIEPIQNIKPQEKECSQCVVCLTNRKEIVLLPCWHMCLCAECTPQILKSGKCPVCQTNIQGNAKIFY